MANPHSQWDTPKSECVIAKKNTSGMQRGGRASERTHPRGGKTLLLEAQSRQDWRALLFNCIESAGVEP
jgi:hypothetical protein